MDKQWYEYVIIISEPPQNQLSIINPILRREKEKRRKWENRRKRETLQLCTTATCVAFPWLWAMRHGGAFVPLA